MDLRYGRERGFAAGYEPVAGRASDVEILRWGATCAGACRELSLSLADGLSAVTDCKGKGKVNGKVVWAARYAGFKRSFYF